MMDYEALDNEMNTILKKMAKEEPDTEKYFTYTKRLGELQQMAIKHMELELTAAKQNEDAALKRREIIAQEAETAQKDKSSKLEAVITLAKTALAGVAGIGGIAMTMFIEENSIIRTKGWNFLHGLFPRV